ncbi:MAG: ABC transporter ATP-binding protein [Clostridia bacterium]|nr:ABC transporter ATP-binding protein [Clostridia bacterium]MBQ8972523.1 ABC transporter ATP-binding protein [Clostridia bacterium]
MSRIELININKYYGDNHVLKNLNLTIEDGDFMTLLGPSGCGKTTTLRVVSGLERPQGGVMLIDGKEAINAENAFYLEPSKRGLNLVFQSYALWPHMTVKQNIAFGLKIQKLSKAEVEKRVTDSLKMMRIEEYVNRYPNELSGGQQQRVAIARAVASNPRLLLLDEPLSNLDARLRIDMRSELQRLHRELGTTIIYVTHDQVEALTMSTKIALFKAGELSQVSTPVELYMNPIDLQAADFIGNPRINLLEGKAKLRGDGTLEVHSALGDHVFPKGDLTNETIPSGEFDVVLATRPEQVHIETRAADGNLPVKVYANQPAGSETLVSLQAGKSDFLAKQLGLVHYDINQQVYVRIDPTKINVYNAQTTRLIKRTSL